MGRSVRELARKASSRDDDVRRFDFFSACDYAETPILLAEQTGDAAVRADRDAAILRGGQQNLHQQTRFDRGFFGQP